MIIYLAFFINILLIIGFLGSIYNKEDKAAAVFGVLFIVSLGGTGYILFKFLGVFWLISIAVNSI